MRRVSSWVPVVVVVAVLLSLAGCGTVTYVVQKYDGEPRPSSAIAILRVKHDDPLRISSVDREPLDVQLAADTRVHVELLPGVHTVGVYKPDTDMPIAQHVQFSAEPGKAYRVVLARAPLGSPTPWVGRVYEVDRGSDAQLRDVTR